MAPKLSISDKVKKIESKIKELKEKKRLLEAKISYLQTICPHPPSKIQKSTSSDYKGGTDYHWLCRECGLSKVTS